MQDPLPVDLGNSVAAALEPLRAALDAINLVDHHAHSIFAAAGDREHFESGLTEASAAPAPGRTRFDSQLGFAVRQFCAPALGLEPFCAPEDYLARRDEIGIETVNRTLLSRSGIGTYLVDGGYASSALLNDEALAMTADADVFRIVRLESVAEAVALAHRPEAFLDELHAALNRESQGAVGFKSIAAYRCGLGFTPTAPSLAEVADAGHVFAETAQLTGHARLIDPIIIRHLIWWAIADGRPLQFHIGFGDPDLRITAADPLLLQDFLHLTADTATPVMLLHCYPFHREAGFLAHLFPHVFLDLGLAINHTGLNSVSLVRESMELAPFDKLLFSTDAWGLPELVYLGAELWRRATSRVLAEFVADGWPLEEAIRVGTMIGRENAISVYRLAEVAR